MKNKTKKRKFYANAYIYLSLGLLITIAGFLPTYFMRLGQTDASHHFHGITSTLWLLLLIVQPLLYRLGRMKFHRILGWASVVLAPMVVIGGFMMMRLMIINKAKFGPDIFLAYKLAFIDLSALIGFALFFTLALVYRKKLHNHARYMVCTIFGPLLPGLARLFFFYGFTGDFNVALTYSYLLVELVLLILIYNDKRSGKIRIPYVFCFLFFIMQHIIMYFIGEWPYWQSMMDNFAGVA